MSKSLDTHAAKLELLERRQLVLVQRTSTGRKRDETVISQTESTLGEFARIEEAAQAAAKAGGNDRQPVTPQPARRGPGRPRKTPATTTPAGGAAA